MDVAVGRMELEDQLWRERRSEEGTTGRDS